MKMKYDNQYDVFISYRRLDQQTYLRAKPSKTHRAAWVAVILGAVAAVGGGIAWTCLRAPAPTVFPTTQVEKNAAAEMMGYLTFQLTQYDTIVRAYRQFLDDCDLLIGMKNVRKELSDAVGQLMNSLDKPAQQPLISLETVQASLRGSPIKSVDLQALGVTAENTRLELRKEGDVLAKLLDEKSMLSNPERKRLLRFHRENLELSCELLACGVLDLLAEVDECALTEFKTKIAPHLTSLRKYLCDVTWERDRQILDRRLEAVLNQMNQKLGDISVIVSTQNTAWQTEVVTLKKKLVVKGMKEEDAERLIDKVSTVSSLQNRVSETQALIKEEKERIREKFKPLVTDVPGILWGKMRRFFMVSLEDAALDSLALLRRRNDPSYPPAALDAAVAFIRQRETLGVEGGLLAVLFEPPATSHAIYKIGDIVTAVNGVPCKSVEEYSAAQAADGAQPGIENRITLLRLKADGQTFEKIVASLPKKEPQTAFLEFWENWD